MAKGLVKFDEEKCKGCELCVSVCPVKIIKLHEMNINSKGYRSACVEEKDKCIGCANCAVICPDGAISVYLEEGGDSRD
ncbi:4Fe-4S dicluster domain-containing protein [Sinanaerobacter chloroacetimidivorans]|jgi:2-oxoglutarate ferredoxin oxidoreductase subunit delta|uniref:4Fe-4S binding protein n=1 Tax=Sinanaerobacter chloroacetimidivorans TaxID=2818044 RepID=A0A8J7VX78_9FIRM|nr:4Fe-4S binding protein [Sinanaerobacter chloroacetimidivorans]MBR0596714.1 4Fe-4S binding protein [Sinanaerobacter chloroacetimidivorans]